LFSSVLLFASYVEWDAKTYCLLICLLGLMSHTEDGYFRDEYGHDNQF